MRNDTSSYPMIESTAADVLSFLSKIKQQFNAAVKKAGELIQEDVNIPVSEESVNGMIDRYVTKNVKYVDNLTATLHDDYFTLICNLSYKGIKATLTDDFNVVTFELTDQSQYLLFEQRGNTQITEAYYSKLLYKLAASLALFYIRVFLRKDPLAVALAYMDVAIITDKQYRFELAQYFDGDGFIKKLSKFQVKHAAINKQKLYLTSGVNLSGFFDRSPIITEDDLPEEKGSDLVFVPEKHPLKTVSPDADGLDINKDTHTETNDDNNTKAH